MPRATRRACGGGRLGAMMFESLFTVGRRRARPGRVPVGLAAALGAVGFLGGEAGAVPAVTHADPPALTETTAALSGHLVAGSSAQVFVFWGRANAGTNSSAWEHSQDLGPLAPGRFTANLAGLEVFRKYFFAFRAVDASGEGWSAVASFRPQVQGMLYHTGFETSEWTPYATGNLSGQGNWRVTEGSATVQAGIGAHGIQAVQSGPAAFQAGFTNSPAVLWIDFFVLDAGSTNQPMMPTNALAGLVCFSAAAGILALDGDGQGSANFVQVSPSFATNEFTRVTLRADFGNKLYDVWINGAPRRTGLRFKDNSVTALHGLQRRSIATSFLDDVSVSTWGLDADSDGDGLNDLDEAKFYGSYPLLADSDADGLSDAQEVIAGTDPGDERSFFALKIELDAADDLQLRVPTVTGRQYTLQRRASLAAGSWEDVPGATAVAGDGTEKTFPQPGGGTNFFYRATVSR